MNLNNFNRRFKSIKTSSNKQEAAAFKLNNVDQSLQEDDVSFHNHHNDSEEDLQPELDLQPDVDLDTERTVLQNNTLLLEYYLKGSFIIQSS